MRRNVIAPLYLDYALAGIVSETPGEGWADFALPIRTQQSIYFSFFNAVVGVSNKVNGALSIRRA